MKERIPRNIDQRVADFNSCGYRVRARTTQEGKKLEAHSTGLVLFYLQAVGMLRFISVNKQLANKDPEQAQEFRKMLSPILWAAAAPHLNGKAQVHAKKDGVGRRTGKLTAPETFTAKGQLWVPQKQEIIDTYNYKLETLGREAIAAFKMHGKEDPLLKEARDKRVGRRLLNLATDAALIDSYEALVGGYEADILTVAISQKYSAEQVNQQAIEAYRLGNTLASAGDNEDGIVLQFAGRASPPEIRDAFVLAQNTYKAAA